MFFETSARLYQPAYFVKRSRILLELNSVKITREGKIPPGLIKTSIESEIGHFYVVVVRRGQRNVSESVLQVQVVILIIQSYFFFYVIGAVADVTA